MWHVSFRYTWFFWYTLDKGSVKSVLVQQVFKTGLAMVALFVLCALLSLDMLNGNGYNINLDTVQFLACYIVMFIKSSVSVFLTDVCQN